MATIQENIDRIKQAKADIKEAIITKGVEVADDAKIDTYAAKIEEIQQGGGGQFAVDFGEEIATNNEYTFNADKEDVDYYNQIQAERAAYAAGTGGRSDNEILADHEFREKIAWWPKGMTKQANTSLRYYTRLRIIIAPNLQCQNVNYMMADCPKVEVVEVDATSSTRGSYFFSNCYNLRTVIATFDNITEATYMYNTCVNLKDFPTNLPKVTSLNTTFINCRRLKYGKLQTLPLVSIYSAFSGCNSLEEVELDIGGNMTGNALQNAFFGTTLLRIAHLRGWNTLNLVLPSPVLEPESVHYIIQNTKDFTARNLSLHATAKANWEASEYYEEDVARAQELNITIA